MIILLTGAAGFIGFHAARKFLTLGHRVIGIDNLNDYYDVDLKQARLKELKAFEGFEFHEIDLADENSLIGFSEHGVTHILHLAAQAGVRYSLEQPRSYVRSNLVAHLEVLEFARHCSSLKHLVYASSSSVYGDREEGAFSEIDRVRTPASLYAATKLGGEMMAESYARLYNIAQTGLRFFTVYGPWGRPDMAYYSFTDKIMKGQPITLFAPDEMQRDFTYVDDITSVLPDILGTPAQGHRVYNLGNSKPNKLMQLVSEIEKACDCKAQIIKAPKQKGDVSKTFANVSAAAKDFDFVPKTDLSAGIAEFVAWYKNYTR